MKSLFNQIICPHCPRFSVHIFILSLHVSYGYPMGPANFCTIPHAHIFFSKWQPDPHDSCSEIIFSYKAPRVQNSSRLLTTGPVVDPSGKWLLQSYMWQLVVMEKEPLMHNSQLWAEWFCLLAELIDTLLVCLSTHGNGEGDEGCVKDSAQARCCLQQRFSEATAIFIWFHMTKSQYR